MRTVTMITFVFSGLAAFASARASAATATELPPVYEARDAIDAHPARLVGDEAGLTIKDGWLSGPLEGGAYRVQVATDHARGAGPLGAVDVRIQRVAGGFDVAGVWNGGDLHLVVGRDEIRGTALKQISDEQRGYESCHYDIQRRAGSTHYTGLAECLGENPIRLDVQPTVRNAMTDEQNAILLVAYLAAPPAVWNP
jgi:hypothetical protein